MFQSFLVLILGKDCEQHSGPQFDIWKDFILGVYTLSQLL